MNSLCRLINDKFDKLSPGEWIYVFFAFEESPIATFLFIPLSGGASLIGVSLFIFLALLFHDLVNLVNETCKGKGGLEENSCWFSVEYNVNIGKANSNSKD